MENDTILTNEDWKTKYMYLAADMENFKRNMNKRIEEQKQFKHKELVVKLLDVLDNCERSFDFEDTNRGLYDMLWKVLSDDGLEKISITEGEPFDANTMNAVSNIHRDDVMPNHVSVIMKTGYRYKGEILRYADVAVSN